MSGLDLNYNYDNREENKKFTSGSVDATKAAPEPCEFKLRVGYDINDYFSIGDGLKMPEKQKLYDEISPQFLIKNLRDFKSAIIDGKITVEKKRIDDVDRVISECDISTGDTPEKRQKWGLAQKYLREKKQVRLHIHIDIRRFPSGKWERVYIMVGNGHWHWGGFDTSKIDFGLLYTEALKTVNHCKNINSLISALSDNI